MRVTNQEAAKALKLLWLAIVQCKTEEADAHAETLRRFIESLPEQGEAVSDLRSLAHELEGIAADVDAGNGFDHVCRRTLQRVIDALLTTPQPAPEDRRDAALKHCEQVFMSYEINRVDGEEIADRALSIIRAAIISEKS